MKYFNGPNNLGDYTNYKLDIIFNKFKSILYKKKLSHYIMFSKKFFT